MMYSPQRVFEFHDVHEMYAVDDDGLCLTKKTPCIRKLIKWKNLCWRTNRGSFCNNVYPDDGLIGEHWDDEHLVDSHFDNQLLEIDERMLALAYYVVEDDKNRNPMKRPHCITIPKFNVITKNNNFAQKNDSQSSSRSISSSSTGPPVSLRTFIDPKMHSNRRGNATILYYILY